jgi:hypothetical protein
MIFQNSRYEKVTVYEEADTHVRFLGTREPVIMRPADDDRFISLRPDERWDQFAAREDVWGSEIGEDAAARMWWVICDINDVVNPFVLPLERPMRVPTFARVALEVLADL